MRRKHWTVIRALRNDPRVLQRFWKLVQLTDDASSCWEWIGAVSPAGYPSFRIAGRSIAASHVTWFTSVGEFPEGGRLKLRCGNPRCVRPIHLAWALSRTMERAVEALGDGYLPLAGHGFVAVGRAPHDPRVMRSPTLSAAMPSPDGAREPNDDTEAAA